MKNVKIKSIKKIETHICYDLEIENNHNFFANNILVHNCRALIKGDSITSRNGKPFMSCPHLENTIDWMIFDGELYNHTLKDDFNKIVSLVKKQKPTPEDLKESANLVEYWVYDYPSEDPFSKRLALLKVGLYFSDLPYKLVPTYEVRNWEDIKKYHAQFIEEGYEGTIIRNDSTPYENKRSKSLLKYKDFKDEEFEIIGWEEGEGGRAGTIGNFWVRIDKNLPYDISKKENCCKSNVKGDFPFLKDVWENKEKYLGTEATIKFFGFTPDGKLRFPFVIKLNRKEYE